MLKIKLFCKKHIYSISFFAFLLLYNFIFVLGCRFDEISDYVYSFHAVDFSIGFCTSILPGAIYNLFHSQISHTSILIHEVFLLLVLFAFVAYFCEVYLKRAPVEHRHSALTLAIFFLSGTGTFSVYVKDIGSLDVYWVFASVLFFIFLSDKCLYPLLFIPFSLCIMVHYASLICFVPFFVIVALYKISSLNNKKERKLLWASLIFACACALILSVYFLVFQQNSLNYTYDEFHQFMAERNAEVTRYYDWSFYRKGEADFTNGPVDLEATSGTAYALESVLTQIKVAVTLLDLRANSFKTIKTAGFVLLPFIIFLFSFIVSHIKACRKNRLKSFSLVLATLLFFATVIAGNLFSADHFRWFAHSVFCLTTTVVYICHLNSDNPWQVITNFLSGIPDLLIAAYFLIYSTNVFGLYY